MDFYSPWSFVLIMAALVGFAATPALRWADAPPTLAPNREPQIDGLRGLLSLSVFFQHAAIYHGYLVASAWKLPPSRLYSLLGQFGVALFFMVTGYLFWSKMLREHGRPKWINLYVGRIFRIIPLYWCAALLVVMGVVAHTGLHLRVPAVSLLWSLLKWSAGGFAPQAPINGFDRTWIIGAGVFWSLHYEWLFYASLLLIGHAARSRLVGMIVPLLGVIFCSGWIAMHRHVSPPVTASASLCTLLFSLGMSAASAKAALCERTLPALPCSLAVAVVWAGVFMVFPSVNALLPTLLLGASFLLIVFGANLFGIFEMRPMRRLGDISYGIYVLQGPVLAAVFAPHLARAFASTSPLHHWLMVGACGFTLVGLATVAHRYIEDPGVHLGRAVLRYLGRG